MYRWVTFLVVVALPAIVSSTVIRVPADQPTIQAALEAVGLCDTVLLAPGTYSGTASHSLEPYNCLTIMSESGPESTIVELEGNRFVSISVESGFSESAVIRVEGLTLRGGNPAISISWCNSAPPEIRHCIFEQNVAGIATGGDVSKSLVDSCIFRDNQTGILVHGGGADHVVRRSLFMHNGAALDLSTAYNTLITGNIIAYNTLGMISQLAVTFTNNVVYANAQGVVFSSLCDFQCNDVFDNDFDSYNDLDMKDNNLVIDPRFCDPTLASGTGVHERSPLLVGFNDCDVNIGDVEISCSCCVGHVGDVNNSGDDTPTIGDISALIDAKFITGSCAGIVCLAEADINQSGGSNPTCDDITIGDISFEVAQLFILLWPSGLPECL
jgi:hypothetical protein